MFKRRYGSPLPQLFLWLPQEPGPYSISFQGPSNALFSLWHSQGACMLPIVLKNKHGLSGGSGQLKRSREQDSSKYVTGGVSIL